jgi:hypothetical protein
MIWDLKETAKWASNPEEKKAAIRSLSAQGAAAVPSLEEIMGVTAYDDIKVACAEAIRSAREKENNNDNGVMAEKTWPGRKAKQQSPPGQTCLTCLPRLDV